MELHYRIISLYFGNVESTQKRISSLTCPVGGVRVLLAALDSLHGICQCCASLGSVEQGSVEGMDKHFGGCDRDRPQGHKSTLSTSSQEGRGQSHNTICCHFAAGLLVRPAANTTHTHIISFESTSFQALFALYYLSKAMLFHSHQ